MTGATALDRRTTPIRNSHPFTRWLHGWFIAHFCLQDPFRLTARLPRTVDRISDCTPAQGRFFPDFAGAREPPYAAPEPVLVISLPDRRNRAPKRKPEKVPRC